VARGCSSLLCIGRPRPVGSNLYNGARDRLEQGYRKQIQTKCGLYLSGNVQDEARMKDTKYVGGEAMGIL